MKEEFKLYIFIDELSVQVYSTKFKTVWVLSQHPGENERNSDIKYRATVTVKSLHDFSLRTEDWETTSVS